MNVKLFSASSALCGCVLWLLALFQTVSKYSPIRVVFDERARLETTGWNDVKTAEKTIELNAVPMPSRVLEEVEGFPSDSSEVDRLFEALPGEGCAGFTKNTKSFTSSLSSVYNQSSYLHLDLDLIKEREANFHRLPAFDDNFEQWGYIPGGVALFKNAFAQSSNGGFRVVFDCESVYFPGGCRDTRVNKTFFNPSQIPPRISTKKPIVIERAVLIGQLWGENYFHGMAETLPRLAYVIDFLRKNPDTAILHNKGFIGHKAHNLNQLLALDENQTWFSLGKRVSTLHVKQLMVPTASRCGTAQPKAIEILQKTMRNTIPNAFSDHVKAIMDPIWAQNKSLIVIQVRKKPPRKLSNHRELIIALRREFKNTHVIRPFIGTETLAESAVMHHYADVVIGPHGAGLVNTVFSKPTAGMVELHPRYVNQMQAEPNICHQKTARATGMRSRMLIENCEKDCSLDHFSIDIDEAIAAVREMIDGQKK
mmetsp:Transcript_27249/g.41847  ORF Transcript_27249/g.41847 Transcript_27249/m.41847 type:complete len:481 (-) Transcript_27249:221-1663(-)|eukprot:CAMPEP_0118706608 /NCGR_PEP_ID=MMETSP0800-20121206/20661_1 /TAXON_ID=210618 ORGANISM="Striatella unipunctata, Strain CCMP2910" /NCGR_SAMPLE_ID=MMETSP0800 /ASSEMBLY_ACC=CAM_ASM_000638 /LENGTH=480 /DNA_ID=CAMNT_0006609179 /DNA_START=42 /DNA_END=1484 /DNA_ORIENTATION=+